MCTDHTHRKCVRILRQTRDPAHRVENMVGGAQWSFRDFISLFQPGPDRNAAKLVATHANEGAVAEEVHRLATEHSTDHLEASLQQIRQSTNRRSLSVTISTGLILLALVLQTSYDSAAAQPPAPPYKTANTSAAPLPSSVASILDRFSDAHADGDDMSLFHGKDTYNNIMRHMKNQADSHSGVVYVGTSHPAALLLGATTPVSRGGGSTWRGEDQHVQHAAKTKAILWDYIMTKTSHYDLPMNPDIEAIYKHVRIIILESAWKAAWSRVDDAHRTPGCYHLVLSGEARASASLGRLTIKIPTTIAHGKWKWWKWDATLIHELMHLVHMPLHDGIWALDPDGGMGPELHERYTDIKHRFRVAWDAYVKGIRALPLGLSDDPDHPDDYYYYGRLAECFPDISMTRMVIEDLNKGLEHWGLGIPRSQVQKYVEIYKKGFLHTEMHTLWHLLDEYYTMSY